MQKIAARLQDFASMHAKDMNLEQAIAYTIKSEGVGIVNEKRFVNYLHDLGAFQQPAMKRIMTVMVEGGYCSKLITSIINNTYSLVANDILMALVQREGLNEAMVFDAINAFSSTMGQKAPTAGVSRSQTSSPTNTVTQPQCSGELKVTSLGGKFKIELNGNSYILNAQQYKSIIRKKNCPTHVLESWLKSYSS